MNETLEKFVLHTYPHRLNISINMHTELDSLYSSFQAFLTPMQEWMIDDEQANMVTFRLQTLFSKTGIDDTIYAVCFRHAHDATTFKLMWL